MRSKAKRTTSTDTIPPAGTRVWTTGLSAQPSRATMLLRHLEAMLAKGEMPYQPEERTAAPSTPSENDTSSSSQEIEDAASSLLPALLGSIEQHQKASLREAISYLTTLIEETQEPEQPPLSPEGSPTAGVSEETPLPFYGREPTAASQAPEDDPAKGQTAVGGLGPSDTTTKGDRPRSVIAELPEISGPDPHKAAQTGQATADASPETQRPGSAAIWALLQSLSATGTPMPRLESLHAVILAYAEAAKLFR